MCRQRQVVEVKAFGKGALRPSAAAGYWTSALVAEVFGSSQFPNYY